MNAAPSVPLKDVEWRLDSEPKDGDRGTRARFVPHINARTAAALMDEWVGPMAWADEYRTVTIAGKEAILCSVSVWDGERWVTKQDVGVPTNTEAQKGGISDAFKRTVTVKWGCGRNVYDLPTLWAPCRSFTDSKGKVRGYANDQTLPDLLRQLKQLGFDADGCRLEDGASDENAGGGTSAEVSRGSVLSDAEAGTPPAPSPAPERAGKNKVQRIQARIGALGPQQNTAWERAGEWKLPNPGACNPDQIESWDALLKTLEPV